MSRKRSNINKNFMALNAVLFIAVMAITVLFLYLAYTLKRDAEKKKTYIGEYRIEVSTDFAGEDISIYVNDSLLTKGIVSDSVMTCDIKRFAEEHVLMIVDNETDVATPFNLNKEGSKVIVKRTNDEVVFEETPVHP